MLLSHSDLVQEKIAQCKAQMEADLKRQLEMLGDDDVSDAAAKAELTSSMSLCAWFIPLKLCSQCCEAYHADPLGR